MKIKHILQETSIIYTNQNATRSLKIPPRLLNIIQAAGKQAGIDRIEIFSGGQVPKGQQGPRTGSTRHDTNVGAADVNLYVGVQRLSAAQEDPRIAAFIQAARALGAVGIGAGPGYMNGGIHVGFGKPAVWGKGGSGANAPNWVKAAYNAGASGQAPATPATAPTPRARKAGANFTNLQNTGKYDPAQTKRVKKVQTLLQRLGYDVGNTGIDGKFGPRTERAVRRFQQDNGLQVDGIVGPETAKALTATKGRSPRGQLNNVQTGSAQGIATNAKANGSLSSMRQKFKQELQDAEFLDVVLALATAEVGPSNDSAQRAVLETLMNRAIAYNRSIREEVYGGYYQPINQSATIKKRLATIKSNPQLRKKVLDNLKAVLAGSNDSNFALHNASAGIAKTARSLADVRAVIGGETFYNKTNPAGDKHYGGGYSGVRNKEQKFVDLVIQSLKNNQTGKQK